VVLVEEGEESDALSLGVDQKVEAEEKKRRD